MMIKNNSKRQK